MKRKDETISLLQTQLEEQTNLLEHQREMATSSEQYNRALGGAYSNIDADADAKSRVGRKNDQTLRTLNASLEQEMSDLRQKMREQERLHEETKDQLQQALESLDDMSRVHRGTKVVEKGKGTISGTDPQHQELRGLRERTLDQQEQIEVPALFCSFILT